MTQQNISVFDLITERMNRLSKREKEISHFVVDNPEFVATSTISDIAKKIQISESSINRFCKKIGYKGFNDFKLDLVRTSTVDMIRERAISNVELSFADTIAVMYKNSLANTSANITDAVLDKTVDAIKVAKKIIIIGNNIATPAIQELFNNFLSLRLDVSCYTDDDQIALVLGNVTEKDLVIMIAPNLFLSKLYNTLTQLADKSIKVIGITAHNSSQLNELLYVKYIAHTNSYIRKSEMISINFHFIFVCDAILNKLINSDDEFMKLKMKANSSITRDSFMHDEYL